MSRAERDSGALSVRPSEQAAVGAGRPRSRGQMLDSSSRAGSIAQVLSVLTCVAAITAFVHLGSSRKTQQPPAPLAVNEPAAKLPAPEEKTSEPGPVAVAEPTPAPAPPDIDRAAVAQAEAELDAASRDRARADERAAAAAREVERRHAKAATDAARARKLAFMVRDPSTRIAQASTRGGFLKGERDKVQKELSTLRQLPRPKSASILSKSARRQARIQQ